MAVLMVSGNALNILPKNIYDPVSTMAAFIVSQLDSAMQDPTNMAVRALAEVALLLMLISIIVNAAAQGLLWLSGRRA
jgi:phosphate transport system permease protein